MNNLNNIDELVQEFYSSAEAYGVKADEAVFLLVLQGLREMVHYFEDNPDQFEEGHEPNPWRLLMCELAEMKDTVMVEMQERMAEATKEAADATQQLLDRAKKGGAA